MMAPAVKRPPSRTAWKATMLTVIGKMRIAARASRLVQRATKASAKTKALMIMMYFAAMSASMKAKASGLLYKSAVGAGKMPKVPRIGMSMIRLRMTLRMTLRTFIGLS